MYVHCSNQELKSERIPDNLDCFNWLLHDFCNRGTSIKNGYAVVIVGNGCDLSLWVSSLGWVYGANNCESY